MIRDIPQTQSLTAIEYPEPNPLYVSGSKIFTRTAFVSLREYKVHTSDRGQTPIETS
jgi:hypothetical protein